MDKFSAGVESLKTQATELKTSSIGIAQQLGIAGRLTKQAIDANQKQAEEEGADTNEETGMRKNSSSSEKDGNEAHKLKPKKSDESSDKDARGRENDENKIKQEKTPSNDDDQKSLSSLGSNCMADAVLPPGPNDMTNDEIDCAVDEWLQGACSMQYNALQLRSSPCR